MARQRTLYQDKWNTKKVWEVTKLIGGYYLRQYIDGKQFGRGARVTKGYLRSIGILDFEVIEVVG